MYKLYYFLTGNVPLKNIHENIKKIVFIFSKLLRVSPQLHIVSLNALAFLFSQTNIKFCFNTEQSVLPNKIYSIPTEVRSQSID